MIEFGSCINHIRFYSANDARARRSARLYEKKTSNDTTKPNSFICRVSIGRINCIYVEYLYSRFNEKDRIKYVCTPIHKRFTPMTVHRNLFFFVCLTLFSYLYRFRFHSPFAVIFTIFHVSLIGTKNAVVFFAWHCITKETRDNSVIPAQQYPYTRTRARIQTHTLWRYQISTKLIARNHSPVSTEVAQLSFVLDLKCIAFWNKNWIVTFERVWIEQQQ